MQVSVAHSVLQFSFRSRTMVLQCIERFPFGDTNNGLLDAGAFLESRAMKGRQMGLDVLVRPLEVAWIDGTRVSQAWTIELDSRHE